MNEEYRQRERRNDDNLPVNNNLLDKQEGYHRQKRNDNMPSKQQVSWPREEHNIEDGHGMPKHHWVRNNWRIIDVPNEVGQILYSEEKIVEMRIVWGRSTTITSRTTPTTNYIEQQWHRSRSDDDDHTYSAWHDDECICSLLLCQKKKKRGGDSDLPWPTLWSTTTTTTTTGIYLHTFFDNHKYLG